MKTKVIIYGNDKDKILDLVSKYGFSVVDKSPEFVVSFGGDGTVMHSEAQYPGIPKIILKNSRVCKLCSPLENDEVLKRIKSGKYKIEDYWKLIGRANGKELLAMNDITVHNGDPRHAIRYKFAINGKFIGHEVIGDGVVISTPFGSTGYYRSITDSFFEVGIGLAFNNSTEQSDHMVIRDNKEIILTVTRGPAVVYADNQENNIILQVGDTITIKKSKEVTRIVRVK